MFGATANAWQTWLCAHNQPTLAVIKLRNYPTKNAVRNKDQQAFGFSLNISFSSAADPSADPHSLNSAAQAQVRSRFFLFS
jgi:hypothetical protein